MNWISPSNCKVAADDVCLPEHVLPLLNPVASDLGGPEALLKVQLVNGSTLVISTSLG